MKSKMQSNPLLVKDSWIVLTVLGVLLFGMLGCGSSEPQPNLVPVSGKVTMDGQPVEGATIAFTPKAVDAQGHGRPSMGATGADGTYSLMYVQNQVGALVGEHTVTISKLDGTPDVPGEELIPARYNMQSKLSASVSKNGPQTFDFELKSKR